MFNIAVLISGGGSNLKSLIDNQKEYYKINIVIADRDCGGLNIAKDANIDAVLIDRKEYKEKLSQKIDKEFSIDFINKCRDKIDAIFHQGACSDTMEMDGNYMMKNNYETSKNILHMTLEVNLII